MSNYVKLAIRTESSEAPESILQSLELAGLLERVLEVGEVADLFKKSTFYDGNLDRLSEEDTNDLAFVAEAMGITYARAMNPRLLHAGLGMFTEAVEFLEALHKASLNNEELDTANLAEELGDQFWYQAIAADELGTTFEREQERNNEKLKIRFPAKFTQEDANNRDLDAERAVIERD